MDLPLAVGIKYRQQLTRLPLRSGGSPLLPIHNPDSASKSSSISAKVQNTRLSSSSIIQRYPHDNLPSNANDPETRNAREVEILSETSGNCFLHWCVDISRFETCLYHIPVPRLNDVSVISALKSAYNTACGFRRWVSLTACYSIKFVMVMPP